MSEETAPLGCPARMVQMTHRNTPDGNETRSLALKRPSFLNRLSAVSKLVSLNSLQD